MCWPGVIALPHCSRLQSRALPMGLELCRSRCRELTSKSGQGRTAPLPWCVCSRAKGSAVLGALQCGTAVFAAPRRHHAANFFQQAGARQQHPHHHWLSGQEMDAVLQVLRDVAATTPSAASV